MNDKLAFPTTEEQRLRGDNGMTLREYYIGQIINGLCANPNAGQEWTDKYAVDSAINLANEIISKLK